MLRIEFPKHPFRLKKEDGKEWIFDEYRKLWVRLTPEEWVRQHFLQYLVQEMKYPASLIAVEKEIRLFERRKRFDLLVYDAQHAPWMMVECKAPEVELTATVLDQLLRYHLAVPVPYLVITNGHFSRGFGKKDGALYELEVLPP